MKRLNVKARKFGGVSKIHQSKNVQALQEDPENGRWVEGRYGKNGEPSTYWTWSEKGAHRFMYLVLARVLKEYDRGGAL